MDWLTRAWLSDYFIYCLCLMATWCSMGPGALVTHQSYHFGTWETFWILQHFTYCYSMDSITLIPRVLFTNNWHRVGKTEVQWQSAITWTRNQLFVSNWLISSLNIFLHSGVYKKNIFLKKQLSWMNQSEVQKT